MSTEKSTLSEITTSVIKLTGDLEMLRKYAASPEKINETVIACYSNLKEYFQIGLLPNDHALEAHRIWLVQQAFWLLDNLKLHQQLKFDLTKDARKWLEFRSLYNYSDLRDRLHIYYWLKREDIGIKTEIRTYYGGREKEEILTSDQLDSFYCNTENRHKVYLALATEVYPPQNRYYPNPFADSGAKVYYDLYSHLLTYPETQRIVPAGVDALE